MQENALLSRTVRSIGAAWRASRLYPPESPMTAEAAQRVADAVEEYVQAEPALKLDIVRGGFVLRGIDGVLAQPGIPELADALGEHGIGELHFVAPPIPEEIISFLTVVQERPHELHANGGMQTALTRANVHAIRVVAVVLSKIETPPEIPEEDADKFLAELAADAGRLAVWLRSLLASDDEGLSDGILTLANAAVSVPAFGRTMAAAFLELEIDDKDRLLEASINLESIRHVSVEMLANLSAIELTAAIRGGNYGKNLMALSYALTSLPVGNRADELLNEATQALSAAGVGNVEIQFLERIIALRRAAVPEPPLVDGQSEFRLILDATGRAQAQAPAMRQEVAGRHNLDGVGVAEIMHLLDLAEDYRAYSSVLGALSRSVPYLIGSDPDLAMSIVRDISRRAAALEKPWPELPAEFGRTINEMCGLKSMTALVDMYASHERAIDLAKELVTIGGEASAQSLAGAALDSESDDSIEFAEAVLGRRLPELLVVQVPHAEARHAAKLAELFARDGGPNSMRALGQLVARPDEQVRSRTARGIVAGGGQALSLHMPKLLRDESSTVALVACSALTQCDAVGSTEMMARRLGELEDERELPLAREIIKVLSKSPTAAAESALSEMASKGGLLRKGPHPEMKHLAQEALKARKGGV